MAVDFKTIKIEWAPLTTGDEVDLSIDGQVNRLNRDGMERLLEEIAFKINHMNNVDGTPPFLEIEFRYIEIRDEA